jgi:hypothetical protein
MKGEGGKSSLERKLKVGGGSIREQRSQLRKRIPQQVFSRGFVFILLSNLPLLKKKKRKIRQSGGVRPVFVLLIRLLQCLSPPPLDQCVSTSGALLPAHPSFLARGLYGKDRHTASSARVISTSDKRDGENEATARKHVVLKCSDGTFLERVKVDMFFSRREARVCLDFRAIDMELKYRVIPLQQQQCLLNRHVVTAVVSRYETGN